MINVTPLTKSSEKKKNPSKHEWILKAKLKLININDHLKGNFGWIVLSFFDMIFQKIDENPQELKRSSLDYSILLYTKHENRP